MRHGWRSRPLAGTAAKGMNDEELAKALAYEIGAFGGSGGPDSLCLTYQAAGLKIWIDWEIVNAHEWPPVFQGQATVAMARAVYRIKDPADKQLALLNRKFERRIDWRKGRPPSGSLFFVPPLEA